MGPLKYANLDLFEHDEDEVIHGEFSRHPIGVFLIIFNTLILLGLLGAALFLIVRNQENIKESLGVTLTTDLSGAASLVFGFLMILVLVGGAMAIYVYRHNYVVLTDQKVVLSRTSSIFMRKISQLSIGDIQDVTIDQKSILSRMFNYGTMRIETAGEQSNFNFPYAPDPYVCGKHIVEAHEKNLQLYGN